MIVTVNDSACKLYFTMPSVLVRIDLILSCELPQPPLGRLGILNFTAVSAASETAGWVKINRKRLVITKKSAIFLYFMEFSFFNYRFLLRTITAIPL